MIDKILQWLDKHDIPYKEYEEHYTLPTVCHNLVEGSNKLYLYKNEDTVPLFHCYTACGDTFNIYTLVQRYYALRNKEFSFREAYKEIHGNEANVDWTHKQHKLQEVFSPAKPIDHPLDVMLPAYSINESALFPESENSPWGFEGISADIIQYYGIRYCPYTERLLIPHRDWRDRTIGYRIRHFSDEQMKYGKYRPLENINGTGYYKHPLSYNLYGWSEAFDIHTTKEIYMYEGEKSVLLHAYLLNLYNAVAVCGSSISKWQQRFICLAQPTTVYICFDRDYTNWEQLYDKLKQWKQQTTILQMFCNVIAVVDVSCNILQHKASPIDQTVDNFNALKRINLKDIM